MIVLSKKEFKFFSVCLIFWSWAQGLSTSLSIVSSLIFIIFSAYMLLTKRKEIQWAKSPFLYWLFCLFSFTMLVSLIWNWTDMSQPTRGLSKLRYVLIFILAIPWLIHLNIDEMIKKLLTKVMLYLNFSYALASIAGIYAMIFCFQLNQWETGCTGRNPGMTGIMQYSFETPLIIGLGFILLLFKKNSFSKNEIKLLIISIILMFWGLLISNSRGAIVGIFIVSFLSMFWIWKKLSRKIILILLLSIACSIVLTAILKPEIILNSRFVQAETSGSTSIRMTLNRLSLEAFQEKPLLGFGLLHPKTKYLGKHDETSFFILQDTHNTYTQVLVDGGIFSFIFYLVFFSVLIFKNWKSKLKELNLMNVIWICFLITSSVHSMLVTGTGTAVLLLVLLVANVVTLYKTAMSNTSFERTSL